MKDKINNSKKLIISHVADVDGISALILAQLHFGDIDYCLVEFSELEDFLKTIVENGTYKNYDEIYVTDVSFRTGSLELIDSNEELKKRIRHFDHHMSETGAAEKYSFVNEVKEIDGKKMCGTTLFYNHIEDDFKYKSEYLDKYLQAVCDYDTGGPLCGNQYGVDLTTLVSIIGIDTFIKKFSAGIKYGKDPMTEEDYALINMQRQKEQEYIEECDKNLIRIELNGHNVGVVVSELYRSSVGTALSSKYKDELDYILIPNFMRMQYSFRTVRKDINVGQIAKSLCIEGGGNPGAGGMPINADTAFILDLIRDGIIKKEKELLLQQKQS